MRKSIIILICTLLLFPLSGCDDLFRDTPNDKLPLDLIWEKPELLDGYVLPWYRNMSNGFKVLMPTHSLLKNLCKEFLPWYGDQITPAKIDWYNTSFGDALKSSGPEITLKSNIAWSDMYAQIRSINLLLENSGKIKEGAQKTRILGEAHFFRGFYYYKLLRQYGAPLLITQTFDPLTDHKKFPRTTYAACVEFIAEEATLAASLLSEDQIGENLGRITKGAAWMLKAKAYFWASGAKFQNRDKSYLGFSDDQSANMLSKAADAYDVLMAMHHYDLIEIPQTTQKEVAAAYRKIFLARQSKESILEVNHSKDGDIENGYGHKLDRDAASPFFTGTTAGYCPTLNHVKEYRMANGKRIDEEGSGYDKKDPYTGRDFRFYANILYDGAVYNGHVMEMFMKQSATGKPYDVPGVDITKYSATIGDSYTNTGYYMLKFLNEAQKIDTDPNKASSQNYIIWRYAEVLLDYAEIEFKLGRGDKGLGKINQIRRRVHMPELTAVTWDDIFNERRVELAFEETTYWDLLRWGIAEERMSGESNPRFKSIIKISARGTKSFSEDWVEPNEKEIRRFREQQYFLPIPWDEIRYHGIEQNPNWIEF